jgi:Protein of unknown function (DUF3754)
MPPISLLRFIPFRKADIIEMCLADGRLTAEQHDKFRTLAGEIQQHFHESFYSLQEQLKNLYASHDPDSDTRFLMLDKNQQKTSTELADVLVTLLDNANYEVIDRTALQAALDSESMFKIRLHVDLDEFDEVLLYCRGLSEREETITSCFGLLKKQLTFINYDRVVLYIRVKDELNQEPTPTSLRPGSVMLKLFQNVPQSDVEMLFPNTQVGMRLLDKLLIGIPAIVSGGIVLTTKLGATLVLLGSLLGYWLGSHNQPVNLDKGALIALGAGMGAVLGYLWKQFSNYKNRKLRFSQSLTQNLYFKLLDTNAGVFYRLINDAEESECKETLLAYYFLLTSKEPLSAEALDTIIEQWFEKTWQCRLDFEIEDALKKLRGLSLATESNGFWVCI